MNNRIRLIALEKIAQNYDDDVDWDLEDTYMREKEINPAINYDTFKKIYNYNKTAPDGKLIDLSNATNRNFKVPSVTVRPRSSSAGIPMTTRTENYNDGNTRITRTISTGSGHRVAGQLVTDKSINPKHIMNPRHIRLPQPQNKPVKMPQSQSRPVRMPGTTPRVYSKPQLKGTSLAGGMPGKRIQAQPPLRGASLAGGMPGRRIQAKPQLKGTSLLGVAH